MPSRFALQVIQSIPASTVLAGQLEAFLAGGRNTKFVKVRSGGRGFTRLLE